MGMACQLSAQEYRASNIALYMKLHPRITTIKLTRLYQGESTRLSQWGGAGRTACLDDIDLEPPSV